MEITAGQIIGLMIGSILVWIGVNKFYRHLKSDTDTLHSECEECKKKDEEINSLEDSNTEHLCTIMDLSGTLAIEKANSEAKDNNIRNLEEEVRCSRNIIDNRVENLQELEPTKKELDKKLKTFSNTEKEHLKTYKVKSNIFTLFDPKKTYKGVEIREGVKFIQGGIVYILQKDSCKEIK